MRGAYYTPEPIARFLSKWAIRSVTDKILEPSCGDGVFLEAAAKTLKDLKKRPSDIHKQLKAIEIEKPEALKARNRLNRLSVVGENVVTIGDFFSTYKRSLSEQRFDVVIGNPPFVRYQNFPDNQRQIAFEIMRGMGLHPSGLTNAWLPFICAATKLLTSTGRMAFVVPAELLQVNYAAELRLFLSTFFRRIKIFTFRKLVFSGILQEVVLICAERGTTGATGITIIELDDIQDLETHIHAETAADKLKPIDHSTEKWTQYFLTQNEILLLRHLQSHPQLITLGKLASVDVGVVTGLNEFFVLNAEALKSRNLKSVTKQIVTRSGHLRGILFSNSNWEENCRQGMPTHLLDLPKIPKSSLATATQKYINFGEYQKHNTGYKCRIRNPWYCVPSSWRPDAFMLRQIHQYPKIILNQTQATCTDTIHRVRLLGETSGKNLAISFLNSLTFAFSEIFGRSYGGGVLELEPKEAEKLLVPYHKSIQVDIKEINWLLLNKSVGAVLELTDNIFLKQQLGLTRNEIYILRGIWSKLKERRAGRKQLPNLILKKVAKQSLRAEPQLAAR